MGNIWEFLYQTLTVSAVAAVLLLVKWLLRDKLSPRWQYGVWAVLALRAVIPAGTARSVAPALALWLETAKGMAELGLDSAYSGAFDVIRLGHVLPWADSAPRSVTDWLFVLYSAGAVLVLAWYVYRYARLRRLLRRGEPVSAGTAAAINAAAEKYGLATCRAVAVPGLRSAFVCGVFRPVLAVPAGDVPDEKIILHELLHLKYRDAAQNVLWCLLRALHWCNPFMQYVFDRIGNDMESLCDQRVLERLEGEERRKYGAILLGMANGAYARAPGTSSISNGAKNISRRIEAIARFKLYPRGMALVSVCAALVLGASLLTGAAADYGTDFGTPYSGAELSRALAVTRLQRCSTVAGALDTYAKGALSGNGLYLAMASPLSEQEAIYDEISAAGLAYWVNRKPQLDMLYDYSAPTVMNLREGGGGYLAEIAVTYSLSTDTGNTQEFIVLPVEVRREDGSFVVVPRGEQYVIHERIHAALQYSPDAPTAAEGSVPLAGGTLTASIATCYDYANGSSISAAPDPDAEFAHYMMYQRVFYAHDDWCFDDVGLAAEVGLRYQLLGEYDPDYTLGAAGAPVSGGSSTDGSGFDTNYVLGDPDYVSSGGGTGTTMPGADTGLPAACAVRVYADGVPVGEAVVRLEMQQ